MRITYKPLRLRYCNKSSCMPASGMYCTITIMLHKSLKVFDYCISILYVCCGIRGPTPCHLIEASSKGCAR